MSWKRTKQYPSVKELVEAFDYDEETGLLTWAKNGGQARFGREAGTTHRGGYRKVILNGGGYYVHRIVWLMHDRQIQDGNTIDHVDGDPQNNRIENLREIPMSKQGKNKRRYETNKSGYPGVFRRHRRWSAAASIGGKGFWIGTFDSFDEAVSAKKAFEAEHGYHENHGEAVSLRREYAAEGGKNWKCPSRKKAA